MRMDQCHKAGLLFSLLLVVATPLHATQVGGPRPQLPPLQPMEGVWEATVTWMQEVRTGVYVQQFWNISEPTKAACEAQLNNIGPGASISKFCTFRPY